VEHARGLSSGQVAAGDAAHSDADLLLAVDEWLAASGVQDIDDAVLLCGLSSTARRL